MADQMDKQGTTLSMQTSTTELLEAPLFVMPKYIDDQRGTVYQCSTTASNTLGHTSFYLHMLSNTCMGTQRYFCNFVPQFAPCTTP